MFSKNNANEWKPNLWGDSLPYLEYIPEMEAYIMDEGGLMSSFICQPLNGVNEEIQRSLEDLFKQDFPADSFVQFSLFASPDIKPILNRYESNRGHRHVDKETSDILDGVARANYEFMELKTHEPFNEESEIILRDFEVWVTLTLPTKGLIPTSEEIDTFMTKKRQLFGVLESVYLFPRPMKEEDFLQRLKVIHNWGQDSGWKTNPNQFDASKLLRDQVLDKGNVIRVHDDGIEMGNTERDDAPKDGRFIKLLSINHYPRVLTFGQFYSLVVDWERGTSGIRCPFLITLNLHYPNQNAAKDEIVKSRTWVSHMNSTVFGKWVDRLSWQKEDYDLFHNAVEKNNAQITNAYVQIALFCKNRKDGERVAQSVQSHAAKSNWTLSVDRYMCLPLFKAALPGGQKLSLMKSLKRYSKFPSTILKHLCPIIASWKGNGHNEPVYPLVTRDGQLFMFNPFESDGNFNISVAASSGSGKSFAVNGLIANLCASGQNNGGKLYHEVGEEPLHSQMLHDGSRVFVIDVGRSYQKLAQMMNGQFVVFDETFKYSLNPFMSIHEFDGKEGQADMVISLISYMAAPEHPLTQYQSSELANIIGKVWKAKGNKALIDDVSQACHEHEQQRMKDIGSQLEMWCRDGIYGSYFSDEHPPLEFDGHFVVFELEELKSKKILQRAVLLQCISRIQHEMFLTGKDKKKMMILDEAWEFLSGGAGSDHIKSFLEAGWRRFRKYNSSGVCISQSISDYYKSDVGEAIIANSQWKVLLRQEPESVDQAQAQGKFTGTQAEFDLIKSLHTIKGRYSEIYIRGANAREVVRLYVPRYIQLIYTTDPRELDMISRLMDKGFSTNDAIEEIMRMEEQAALEHKRSSNQVKGDGVSIAETL